MPDGSGTKYANGGRIRIVSDLTLYAQWRGAVPYRVSFDSNGGSGLMEPQTVYVAKSGEMGHVKLNKNKYTRASHEFVGWNTEQDGTGTNLNAGDTYDGSEGLVLYATWEEIKYTVNYDLQGGSNDKIVSVTNPYSTPFEVTGEVPEKVGYKFIEWNTKADGSGIKLAADDIYDRSDGFTLYAIYEEIKEENPIPDVEEKEDVEPPKKEEITTEEEVPKTGDSIVNDIVIAVISFVLLLTSAIVLKKNN
jgi:uncharacterized repeat protein (TIGR02543 family)